MPLNRHFSTNTSLINQHVRVEQSINVSPPNTVLAESLAEYIIKSKFPGSRQDIVTGWQNKRLNNTPNPNGREILLRDSLSISIGEQSSPKSQDHRQGWVAENLWCFLIKGSYSPPDVVRLFDVGLSSTDPGGDGLVFHKDNNQSLFFRLWEIKKVAGSSNINTTIGRAAGQLRESGNKYVSRFVSENQHTDLPQDQRVLIDHLMDHWVQRDPNTRAGVAIVTSQAKATNTDFSALENELPILAGRQNLEGRTITLTDFEAFTEKVCEVLWSGI